MIKIFFSDKVFIDSNDKVRAGAIDFISFALNSGITMIYVSYKTEKQLKDKPIISLLLNFYNSPVNQDKIKVINRKNIAKYTDDCKKNIFLGVKDVDLFNATASKILLLYPTWAATNEKRCKQYGIPISDFKSLEKLITIIARQKAFYYSLKVDERTTVYALTSANNYGATINENEAINKLHETLKNGDPSHLQAIMCYLLAGIMSHDDLKSTDIWGIMPSSGTTLNTEMMAIKKQCRYLTGKKLPENILLRHTETSKSHGTSRDTRLSIGAKKHLDTMILNPYYKDKLANKTVTILDDYVTNGISFEAARNLLEAENVKQINFVAIGRFRSRMSNGLGIYQKESYSLAEDLFSANTSAQLTKRDKDFGMNGKYDESAHADLADLAKLF